MEYLVNELLNTIGAGISDFSTFSELLTWFVTIVLGIEFVLFVLDGIFYTCRNIVRGIK